MRATFLKSLIALLVVAGAGCGDDDDGAEAADTTVTTAAGETTTTIAPPDTTATTVADALGDEPPISDDGPSGSGCTPGDSAGLPDGWWYGTVTGAPAASVDVDLACYYVGAAAEAIAAERGDEVTNDYYVVNDNDAVRTLTVLQPGATASCVDLTGQLAMVDCAPSDVDGDWAVWLRVQGGAVDRIVEQYAP